MQVQLLTGEWQLRRADQTQTIAAQVPGCVHTDLLAAGLLPDVHHRDQETAALDVGNHDWTYTRDFACDEELLAHEHLRLQCDGLDTIATLRLNGVELGTTDNMFRVWEFDIRPHLKLGTNTLSISFRAPITHARAAHERRPLHTWMHADLPGVNWMRKEQCNFGWDWGQRLPTCGIWRPLRLLAWNGARLGDVRIQQQHKRNGNVELTLRATTAERSRMALDFRCSVHLHGRLIAQHEAPLTSNATCRMLITDPQLWWPNGMGAQPLYDLTIELLHAGRILDTTRRRIGLRRLELVRKADRWGQSFHFAVNGQPFFAKGANWIPADTFAPQVTPQRYAHLLRSAAAAHMNMLRVWGGGIYEDDAFYDLCDALGICVWQDFMFACATYPAFDAAFMKNVRAEAEQVIKRLRHRACLALWCGNNELEQGLVGPRWSATQMSWRDYGKLFDKLLPALVAKHDGVTPYWPSSPHTPLGDRRKWNEDTSGDTHLWNVWHGMQPFEWYRGTRPRFVSEFGFQSFTEPRTTHAFTAPDDRNITSRIMEHHQRSGTGNATIIRQMLDWFRLPTSFEGTLWLSQILQALGVTYGLEHWRRNMPCTMGTLYWQLNDCWPVASWSSIDYHGRWKALHHFVRRAYAPLLISGVEQVREATVRIHVTSDVQGTQSLRARWTLTDLAGKSLHQGEQAVALSGPGNQALAPLQLRKLVPQFDPLNTLVWLELFDGRTCVAENLVTLARPKHLDLLPPAITCQLQATRQPNQFIATLAAAHPALFVWLSSNDLDLELSDNFFHLPAKRPRRIRITMPQPISLRQLSNSLRIQSLLDTYS